MEKVLILFEKETGEISSIFYSDFPNDFGGLEPLLVSDYSLPKKQGYYTDSYVDVETRELKYRFTRMDTEITLEDRVVLLEKALEEMMLGDLMDI